jgi:archaetidylinositol phosphate synthase
MESKRGDFLDHVLDRYSDVFIIGGIMLSPYCDYRIGLFAMLGVIFTSYMGTQAQAVGVKRHYGGLLGRADRLALLIIFPFLQLIFIEQNWVFLEVNFIGYPFSLNLMDLLMLWFGIGGNITAIQRGYETWEALGEEEKKASNPGSEKKPKKRKKNADDRAKSKEK